MTTRAGDGEPIGLTANAVSSVSLTPPQLLVCLGKGRYTASAVQERGAFAVNFLSHQQRWIAERFASRDPDKFAGVSVTEGTLRMPLIAGALATAECVIERQVEAGDHIIFIGSVRSGEAMSGKPLMFFQSEYGSWPEKVAAE